MPPKDPVTGKFLSADKAAALAEPPQDQTQVTPPPEKTETPPEKKAGKTDLTGAQALVDSWLGDKPSRYEKKEVKDDRTTDEPSPEKKVEKKAEKKPAKPVAKPAQRTEKPLTAADIAAATAEAVARALPRDRTDRAEGERKTDTPEEPWLTPTDKRKLKVLEQMETLFPDQYRDISKRYNQSKRALVEYAQNWEKEHPGEEFDENAEEHQDFYERNDVEWQDEDYLEAAADLKAQAKIEQNSQETNKRLTEFERKEKLRESMPQIYREQTNTAREFWKLMGEDYADIVDERGQVNTEKYKALQEKDPAIGTRIQFAEKLDGEVAELYKLLGLPNQPPLEVYNEKNPTHRELSDFAFSQEEALMSAPAEDRLDDKGRTFLPSAEYWKLPADQQRKHWTFNATDLAMLRAKDLTQKASQIIAQKEEEYKLWAKARGITLDDKAQKREGDEDREPEEQTDADDGKPVSPSAGGETKMAAGKSKAGDQPTSGASAFVLRSL